MSNSQAALEALARDWLSAKEAEREANAARIAIEDQIIAVTGHMEEGSETLTLENGTKITITGKISYKANILEVETLTADWPDTMQVVRWKPELNEPVIRKIKEMRPELWRKLAQHISTKAAKTSIVIKEPEDGV